MKHLQQRTAQKEIFALSITDNRIFSAEAS